MTVKFPATDYEQRADFEVPFEFQQHCNCGWTAVERFVIQDRPPEGSPAELFAPHLSRKAWWHKVSFYDSGSRESPIVGWSLFSNGARSAVMCEDRVHLFLVQSLVAERGWEPAEDFLVQGESRAQFVKKSKFRTHTQYSNAPIFVTNCMGEDFEGVFCATDAFVSINELHRIGGDFAEVWHSSKADKTQWIAKVVVKIGKIFQSKS